MSEEATTDSTATESQVLTGESLVVQAEELIDYDTLKAFYKEKGIACLDCPAAVIETFAEGAKLHKFDLDATLEELNRLRESHPSMGFDAGPVHRFMMKIFGKGGE